MSGHAEKFASQDGIYLLSHSVGLAPATLRDALEQQLLGPWERGTQNVWAQWLEAVHEFRAALASLFNDDAANFCPQSTVSSGATKILYALPELRQRPTILLSEQAFPSLGFVFQRAREAGFRMKFIDASRDALDPATWAEHLTPDVGLVLITHVHSNTGELIPVRDIVSLARNKGAVSIVDIAQSAGVIPIDTGDWGADFILGSSVKWLCGGSGACFLWANPAIVGRCEPIDVGWFSHADPFEFDIHEFRFAADALRFWGGTPAVAPCVIAAHAIRLIDSIGVGNIRAHNLALTEAIIGSLDDRLLASPREAARRSGTVVVRTGSAATPIIDRLDQARIRYDARATGLRLSPHIYNSAGDIDALIECWTDG